MSKENLKKMLDFTRCDSKEKVLAHASDIATELIRNWEIVTPKGKRRFLGVEFYLKVPGVFEDDATHEREEQLESGTFYFHTKSKNENGWTPPIFNRHGVDITCGDNDSGIYGGILLRHLSGSGHRDGSGLALRSLVRGDDGFKSIKRGTPENGWSADEINFFRQEKENENLSIFEGEMYLQPASLPTEVEIIGVKRVGIEKTKFADELLGFRCEN